MDQDSGLRPSAESLPRWGLQHRGCRRIPMTRQTRSISCCRRQAKNLLCTTAAGSCLPGRRGHRGALEGHEGRAG